MGDLIPFIGRQAIDARNATKSEIYADKNSAPTVPTIDGDSFCTLVNTFLELTEFYELEQCPGRASWLSEISGEFEALITRLEPSQASE